MTDEESQQGEIQEESLEERLSEIEDPLLAPSRLSAGWRLFVALAVIISAGAGASIGVAVARIGCEGCTIVSSIAGGTLGAAFAGVGMAILAVLIARSFEEWRRLGRTREK
jgi:hypothetical protein